MGMVNSAMLGGFIFAVLIPVADAFDWGDFHKIAVIFFSFFGPMLILGAIGAVAYFACIKSWYDSFREEVRETHRSFHPWPPGSAKWQLQQFIRSSRQTDSTAGAAASAARYQQAAESIKSAPAAINSISHKLYPTPLSPGYLQTPLPPANYPGMSYNGSHMSLQQPLPSIMIPDIQQFPSPHPAPEVSPVRYFGNVQQYHHNIQPAPSNLLTPSFTMYEQGRVEEMARRREVKTPTTPEPLEAITVRTTTTTRRTTVLSPVQGKRSQTIV